MGKTLIPVSHFCQFKDILKKYIKFYSHILLSWMFVTIT